MAGFSEILDLDFFRSASGELDYSGAQHKTRFYVLSAAVKKVNKTNI